MSILLTVIAAIIIIGGLRGAFRGFIAEAASVAALFAGGWLSFRYYADAAGMLKAFMPLKAALPVTFFMLLLVGGLAVRFLVSILTRLVRMALLGWLNRLAGLLLGCFEAALLLGLVFQLLLAIPIDFKLKEQVKEEHAAMMLADFAGFLLAEAGAAEVFQP
ncbi:MAG: CvpA family protein [Trichlorobacter sp.]|jgi:membrane protein required for colicin V production|nr:CvpA family protein [Trichlorobacter sp.]